MEPGHQPADGYKVLVKGFPIYTQRQDLTRVFLDYGTVKLKKLHNNCAVLQFSKEGDAMNAVADSGKVNIYGEFLTVKNYTGKEDEEEEPDSPKRECPRSKAKDGAIIDPKLLDFSGDFNMQMDRILSAVRLTQEEVTALNTLYADVEMALQSTWPGCQAIPFGSITTGLGIKTSDSDCFVQVPARFRHPNGNFVNRAKRLLQNYPTLFVEIVAIPRANTPIVKFFHLPTETNCDLTFKTLLGSRNSKLIAFLLQADPRLIPMAVLIKYWAKVHELTGTGRITNYALTMLIIFYLQQPPVSILPSIEWLQRDPAYDVIIDRWNTGFMNRHELLPQSTNTSSIAELLGGFFQYYSTFDFEKMVVCPLIGSPIEKDNFKDIRSLPEAFNRYKRNTQNRFTPPLNFTRPICVQDPFQLSHNVSSSISSPLHADIKAFFDFAAAAYDKDKLNDCSDLLRAVLLVRPPLAREKCRPEFRAVIYPHIIDNIVNPDWKSVIREVMFQIFENICKINLIKTEEKIIISKKKLKEKFAGVITKAIWRRKQFSKLYNWMQLEFIEKQKRITEEVLNVEKKIINIEFILILSFSMESKDAVVLVKLVEGDLIPFREFGKFFMSNMQQWFFSLLKPYLRPHEYNQRACTENKQNEPETKKELTIEVKQTEDGDSSAEEREMENNTSTVPPELSVV